MKSASVPQKIEYVQNKRQLLLSVLSLGIFVILLGVLYFINNDAFMPALAGLLIGYILQRSRFCFASGFRDIFMIGNTTVTRAIVSLLLISGIGFFTVEFLSPGSLSANGAIYPVGIHTMVGGLLFGFGMVIAGSCVSGCLMRMGEGYLVQWITFVGMLLGADIGAWAPELPQAAGGKNTIIVFFPDYFGWAATLFLYAIIAATVYLTAYLYERGNLRGLFNNNQKIFTNESITMLSGMLFKGKTWSYGLGAFMLAIVNILLFALWGKPAGITSGLVHLAGWLSVKSGIPFVGWHYFDRYGQVFFEEALLQHPLIYLSLGIIIGSMVGSFSNSEFRIRRVKSVPQALAALAGGFMLGFSSTMAMGCNIGGLWSGIASFSLHGWVFAAFILVGAYLGSRFYLKYLL